MSASAPFWPMLVSALLFLAIGVALLAWPRPVIAFYIRLIRPMRSSDRLAARGALGTVLARRLALVRFREVV